ncbi:YHS domain-containing (seleno)protein [Pelagibacterium limicola]|uniref:YHS domain-containing (seleno)protein n=1 Tax=Pelagibacterium limicola TaxID=2791022 RepID=UPI0018AFE70D|nr:YHS domain-containing (seleno)protein [Pelagibacterium limicola]
MYPAAAQTQKTVTNFLTGVALSGYDPVSYFTEPEPTLGSPLYEYEWNGVPWYFASEANRDIFINAPAVYAPLFGGHCAMSMARGFLSDGNPQIYRIVEDRLVLFYSVGNREAFELSRSTSFPRAVENWLALPGDPALRSE